MALTVPSALSLSVDCDSHALSLATARANFAVGEAANVTFSHCRLSNYRPGQAANVSNKASSDLLSVPLSLFGDAYGAAVTVQDSFLEHPCVVRPLPCLQPARRHEPHTGMSTHRLTRGRHKCCLKTGSNGR